MTNVLISVMSSTRHMASGPRAMPFPYSVLQSPATVGTQHWLTRARPRRSREHFGIARALYTTESAMFE